MSKNVVYVVRSAPTNYTKSQANGARESPATASGVAEDGRPQIDGGGDLRQWDLPAKKRLLPSGL